MTPPRRRTASLRQAPLSLVTLAIQLALDELHAERDVRPHPGPVRCDVDRRRRLHRLAGTGWAISSDRSRATGRSPSGSLRRRGVGSRNARA